LILSNQSLRFVNASLIDNHELYAGLKIIDIQLVIVFLTPNPKIDFSSQL